MYRNHMHENARLVILRHLHEQLDGRLNTSLIARELDNWGHDSSREFVRTQLDAMASLGAVTLVPITDVHCIAEITEAGRLHLRLKRPIEGIERPTSRVA